ncbi:hypothetical protein WMY93_024288 [Mugilogobius chulae]|uniref:Uncharacterized protein n=1 Tax=Mugilogobius chulae TaxID=88201 RepID=A0AAW0N063_9GOBI
MDGSDCCTDTRQSETEHNVNIQSHLEKPRLKIHRKSTNNRSVKVQVECHFTDLSRPWCSSCAAAAGCWCWRRRCPAPPQVQSGATTAVKPPVNSTRPAGNSSTDSVAKAGPDSSIDSSMIQRALYVLIGITLTGVLYFLIRAVRLKKPAPKKKYGLLSNYDDSVEMEGVESEEDDTLYEARSLRRSEHTHTM